MLYNEIDKLLCARGIKTWRAYVGNYFTSLDMMGATLSVMKLDRELTELMGLDSRCVGFTQVR